LYDNVCECIADIEIFTMQLNYVISKYKKTFGQDFATSNRLSMLDNAVN